MTNDNKYPAHPRECVKPGNPRVSIELELENGRYFTGNAGD